MNPIITDKHELQQLVDVINNNTWFALDTEFIRERTYHSQLCLIQVAVEDHIVGIDPLALNDEALEPFLEVLRNPAITKVLHAAHQDLEIFFDKMGVVPAPIFDSQIAASVLGVGDQIGYARLVETYLSKTLEKSQSRTNWANRPLNQKQISYALDDVKYLQKIYPRMLAELEAQQRMSWLNSDFNYLTSVDTYKPDFNNIWKKVKGNQVLKGVQLAIAQELAIWREEKALKRNEPRKWIMSDDLIIDIARAKPDDVAAFKTLRSVRGNHSAKWQQQWIDCVRLGLAKPQQDWPVHKRLRKSTPKESLVIDLLMVVLNHQAHTNNISPAAIATRKTIEKMVLQGEQVLSNDWRGAIVNTAFSSILNAQAGVFINQEGEVIIDSKINEK